MSAHTGFWKAADRIALWGGVLLILLLPNITQAQEQENAVPLNYEFYTSFQGATVGQTPFWHHANTYGHLQHGSWANWLSGITLELPYYQLGPVDISGATELSLRLSDKRNSAHFTEMYGALRYGTLQLCLGRFRHTVGGTNHELSVGSMMVSPNAVPIPQIRISTSDFFDVPLSSGRLQARILWSEGLLERRRYVPNARLHQKALYFRTLVDRLRLTGGVVHNLQWGGDGKEEGLKRYGELVLSLRGGDENAIASYEVQAELLMDTWKATVHRQFYMEDQIGLLFRSPWDGVWSVALERFVTEPVWIQSFIYQALNTIQQDAFPGLPEGRANYYSHHIYRSGWTYHGNTLGNPLLSNPDYRANDYAGEAPNLMVIAHHIGVRGLPTNRLQYEARFTYSRNYGVCRDQLLQGTCQFGANGVLLTDLEAIPRSELRQDQYATMLNVRYLLSETYGMHLRSSVAVDWGEFDGTQVGLMLGLQWDGTVNL